jgi:tape measure domain-containing protein
MSTTIDQKVVEMRFDNQQFEKNIATTMGSLEKLEKKLDMSGAAKGLQEVERAAGKCDMSGLSSAVETVRTRFSALEVMGVTALANITNSAVNAGKRIASALTIDPVKSGFSEYELKMGSIQTMMAATGESLETVNGYLNELNEYSDKTIYSFSDMTQNIGKFTNAGVSLENSVAAIQGIANVAAVSGANSNEASRAMYNFAQALSSGYVKLIDWKSIELANMGTVEFKNQLLEAAAAAGTLTKTGDGMYKTLDGKVVSATKNFNDSLQDQWMTSEVLIKTLKNYSDESTEIGKKATQAATEVKTLSQLYDTLKESAQSGWAQTWEIIVGDFEEAKEFMTELSEVIGGLIGKQAESRNELLENWKVLGGRTALLESIRNLFEAIGSIVKPISEAFREIFPPMTAERLTGFTEGLRNLTERLILSDDTADKLKRTFKGVFAIIDIGKTIFVALVNAIGTLFEPMGDLGGGLLGVTATIGDLLVSLSQFIKRSNIIGATFQFVAKILGGFISLIGKVAGGLASAFSGGPVRAIVDFLNGLKVNFEDVGISANDMWASIANTFAAMGEALQNSTLFKLLEGLWKLIKTIAKAIVGTLGNAFNALSNSIGKGDFEGVFTLISAFITGGIGVGIVKLIKSISGIFGTVDKLKKKLMGIVDAASDILGSVGDTFKAFQDKLKADALKTIANAILVLVASLILLTFIDKQKLSDALATLTILFAELVGGLAILSGLKTRGIGMTAMSISMALLLLIIPLTILANMDSEAMAAGVTRMLIVLGALSAAMVVMSKIKTNGILRHTSKLSSIAFALILLCIPLKVMGGMEWVEIARGMTGITGVLTVMVAALAIMSKIKTNGVLRHIGLLSSIAWALILMCIPLKIIGDMYWDEIARGLSGMTGVMTIMVSSLAVMSKIKTNGVLKSIALLSSIAWALILMCIPFKIIGGMEWVAIAKGLTGLTGMLVLLISTLAIVSKLKADGVYQVVTKMILIATALLMMTIPFLAISALNWGALARGLVGMFAMLTGLMGCLTLIAVISSKIPMGKTMVGVSQLTVIAAAILMLTVPLMILAALPWNTMNKALMGMIIMIGTMTLALAALATISTMSNGGLVRGASAMIILASAINMLVPALVILAAVPFGSLMLGLAGIAAAFVVLGVAGYVLMPMVPAIIALASALTKVGLAMVLASAGVALFGVGLTLVSAGITALVAALTVVAGSLNVITKGIVGIILALAEGIGKGIILILQTLSDAMPVIREFIKGLIGVLCGAILDCTTQIVDTVLALLASVLESLVAYAPSIVKSLVEIILIIMDGLIDLAGPLVDKLMQFLIVIIEGIARNLAPLVQAIVDVFVALIDGIISALASLDFSGDLTKALVNVGLLAAIAYALAAILPILPAAMAGVVAFGILVTELSLVMAALSALSGLSGAIEKGGDLLQSLGTALGKFIGGFIGGIGIGITAALPVMADNLSTFMTNLSGFITGAKTIDESVVSGIGNLVKVVLMIGAAEVLENIMSILSGGSSIAKFATQIAVLGAGLLNFSNSVKGVDQESVQAAVRAAQGLAEVGNTIPKMGGLFALFEGENSIALFAAQLPLLGYGISGFSKAVEGVVPENVVAAANAAKALAEMAKAIPNSGGLWSLFAGDNDLAGFSVKLPILGVGLLGFSKAVEGIVPENIVAAATAAKSLAEMTNSIPNSGGMVSWFTGDNAVANFAYDLCMLGDGLREFSMATTGVMPENVLAAANAAKALAEMTNSIPNSGGVVSWFAGDNGVVAFADSLGPLGTGLAAFSTATTGITPETVQAAANAAKSLAEMTEHVPKEGGIKAWFSGDSGLVTFANNLGPLGQGIATFATETKGITPETVQAAANAAKSLAEMTTYIPNENGVKAWFGEENGMAKFSGSLGTLGKGIAEFGAATKDVVPESVTKAAEAAKTIVSMASGIPQERSMRGVPSFAQNLKPLGAGIGAFSAAVVDIVPDSVNAACKAAKSLAEMTDAVPKEKVSDRLASFGSNLENFGSHLADMFHYTKNITAEAVAIFKNAISSIKTVASFNSKNITNTTTAINDLVKSLKNTSSITESTVDGFVKSINKIATISTNDIRASMRDLGKKAANSFAYGIRDNTDGAKDASKDMVAACAKVMEGKYSSFKSAGKYLVEGFADGIDANTYMATARAKAMAEAAYIAAKEELRVNSPSKVFRNLGTSVPEGFAQGIGMMGSAIDSSITDMSNTAINGMKDSISRISDIVMSDMDTDPTIRPVLDLSGVESGARRLSGMLNMNSSVGMYANVGAISAGMAHYGQNGGGVTNSSSNITNNTYIIDGVTYDDGSNIASAMEEIVHAARVERRT